MIPRTVRMAQAVAAQLTATELEDFGNIILNGYATTGPNTTGKLGWAWADNPLAPAAPLPSITSVQPALKGWTTNYMQYYTQQQPNGYGVNPGDPTMFDYVVHSFTAFQGPIKTLGGNGTWFTPGSGYTVGTYPATALTGGSGVGATANIVVTLDPILAVGVVSSVTLVNPGANYQAGDSLSAAIPGGTGFYVPVGSITPVAGSGGAPRWAMPPRRKNQLQVLPTNQGPAVNNPAAIQYSFIYPQPDNLTAPPIDNLS